MPKVIVGIDPHKRLNAVVVLDMRGAVLARRSFANTTEGFKQLRAFSRRWRPRRFAIEGCNGVGKHLAQRLLAAGEEVVDVSTRRAALVRVFAEANMSSAHDQQERRQCPRPHGLRKEPRPVVYFDRGPYATP